MKTFHFFFTRQVFGVTWTITVSHEGITFARSSVPHWMPFQNGAQLWEPYTAQLVDSMPPQVALRKAAIALRRMRRGLGISFYC